MDHNERLIIQDFELSLIEVVRILRREFAVHDRNYITFQVDARGRSLDGDTNIEFTLRGMYGELEVKGGRILATLEEYHRRTNWASLNAPLCLPNVEPPEDPDQDPNDSSPF